MTDTPTPAPAPMTAGRLYEVREQYRSGRWGDGLPRELFGHIDALTARVAELERERQYTCEQHRDEVRKGERCVWCELAAARGAFDLSESERQRLAGRINATEARKVEDGDVQDAVDWLRDRAECSSITLDPAPMGPIADLLTRLSAALKEAERPPEDGELYRKIQDVLDRHSAWIARPSNDVTKAIAIVAGVWGIRYADAAEARAQAAEAALKEAERRAERAEKMHAEAFRIGIQHQEAAQAAEAQLKEVRKHSREAYDHLCSNAIESVRRSRAMELLRLVIALQWASDITKRVVALETAPSCQPQGDAKP